MELVDFLHVPEDDKLFVDNARWNLLHPAGHFPQVGLPGGTQGLDKVTPNFQETGISDLCKYVPRVHVYLKIYLKNGTSYRTM